MRERTFETARGKSKITTTSTRTGNNRYLEIARRIAPSLRGIGTEIEVRATRGVGRANSPSYFVLRVVKAMSAGR